MRILASKGSRTLWFERTFRPYSFTRPAGDAGFALLLVAGETGISPDEQYALSEQFVRSGCRHAVCFGPTSSSWDDSIDMVSVMDDADGRPGPLVMTSWFDRHAITEAVDFFADCTAFDDWVPEQFVVVMLGGSDELERDVHHALLARFG
jgi:hypothetical protein